MLDDANEDEIDPAWCAEQRVHVHEYLQRERVPHGELPELPAWGVSPYVAVWEVPGSVSGARSFWAISGDLPTDFLSADTLPDPRSAVRAIAERWELVARYMTEGKQHPTISIASHMEQGHLADLLAKRAQMLADWAAREEVW